MKIQVFLGLVCILTIFQAFSADQTNKIDANKINRYVHVLLKSWKPKDKYDIVGFVNEQVQKHNENAETTQNDKNQRQKLQQLERERVREQQRIIRLQEEKEKLIYQKYLHSRIAGSFSNDLLTQRY